jgi:adenylate cyclase
VKEVKVSNELTELLVWAYKQGFLDATQVLTDSVKSLDEAKIRLQLLADLEGVSEPAAPDKPEAEGSE